MQAQNQAAREGLRNKEQKRPRKFVQKTFPMGAEQLFRWDKALSVADALEDELFVARALACSSFSRWPAEPGTSEAVG